MKKRIEKMRENDEEDVRQRYEAAQNEYQKAEQAKLEQKLR